jgi:hypothetical protein
MIPFIGYVPDLNPATPGVLTDVTNMVPSVKGMKGAPTPVTTGIAALAAACQGIAVLTKLDATRRVIAGTIAGLYEAGASTWTDRSKGGGYSIGADNRWSFAQFGDISLAAAKSETMQYSTTGAFADISGAPKAKLIAVSSGFVMACDTNEGTYGNQSDRWWCSAYLDYSSWTPSVTTQATTGRLVDSPGPIYALKDLGSGFVAYKKDSIFVGTYVSAPAVWDWQQVPGRVGTISNGAVVNVGYAHIFMGMDDFYVMDGSRPVSIGEGIREWFFANVNSTYLFKTAGTFDQANANVYWWYVPRSNTSGTLSEAVVYNIKSKKWGKVTLTVEAVSDYVTPGITYEGLGTAYTTYDSLPTDISFDSPYWTAASPVVSVVKTDHIVYTLTGDPATTSLKTGVLGDDEKRSTVTRAKSRFITVPQSASLQVECDDDFGTGFSTATNVTMTNNTFDFIADARWHRFVESFVGPVEIVGNTYDVVGSGME